MKIYYKINIMFMLFQELKNENELIKVNFSDIIIKNISLLFNKTKITFNYNNEFLILNYRNFLYKPLSY